MKRGMTIGARIRRSQLVEKMQKQTEYCEKLGLTNTSRFHGKQIEKE